MSTTAVIMDKGASYLFIKTETNGQDLGFKKVNFEPGIASEEFVEIKSFEQPHDTTAIVLKGGIYFKDCDK